MHLFQFKTRSGSRHTTTKLLLRMAPYRIKRLTPAEVLAAAEVRAAAEADDGRVRLGSTSVAASATVVTATSVGASAAAGARAAWSLADNARASSSAESHDRGQDLKRQRAGPPLPMMTPLDSFNSRALSVELGKARTLFEMLSLQQRHGNRFDGFNLGAFWCKFKRLPRGLSGLRGRLTPVCEQTVRMLTELTARQVATVAHVFAKAKLVGAGPWESVWAALPRVVHRQLGGFNAQEISNTAWAFATVNYRDGTLFAALAIAAERRLSDFNTQEVANSAWACAVLNY